MRKTNNIRSFSWIFALLILSSFIASRSAGFSARQISSCWTIVKNCDTPVKSEIPSPCEENEKEGGTEDDSFDEKDNETQPNQFFVCLIGEPLLLSIEAREHYCSGEVLYTFPDQADLPIYLSKRTLLL
jgi:hypothetical protein